MKLLKTILGWRPVWLTLLFALLILLVGWVVPALMPNANVDVVQPVVTGSRAALALMWFVSIAVVTVSYLRQNGLRLPSLPRRSAPEVRHHEEAPRQAVAAAVDALSRLPEAGRWPWLAVLGSRGAGKSTALVRGGGACNRLDAGGLPYRPERDERCAVVRCGGAVYLDTTGRWVDEDAGREGWRGLLTALRQRRPEQPLDGLVVVVDLGELLGRGEAEASLLGDRLRARLDDAVETLGVAPPVHLLLTHTERIAGFTDAFQDLPPTEGGRPWGISFDPGQATAADMPGELRKLLQDLSGRAERWSPVVIVRAQGARLGPALLFPAQLRAIEGPLSDLVRRLTVPGAGERCPLVGVWFSGLAPATQELDRLGGGLGRLGTALPVSRAAGAPRGRERPLFLDGLFERVFPATRDHGGVTERELRRRRAAEWGRLKRLVAALALFALSAATVGVLNLLYQRALERRLGEVIAELSAPATLAAPPPTLSARLAVFGAWGAPGWHLPDAGAVVARTGLSEDADPPSRLSALWLWPTRWIAGDDARRWVTRHTEDRLVRAAAGMLRVDLSALSGPIPGVSGPLTGATEAEQDWIICAWSRTQLARRWAEIYAPGEGGARRCADGVLDAGESEVADALAQRLAAGLDQSKGARLCPEVPAADEGRVSTDAWLIQRLFERPEDRCDALAALVPTETEMADVTARLQTIDPQEAAFAMLLQKVSADVQRRQALEGGASSLRPKSKLLRVGAGQRAAPPGYSLDECQQFQLQLYQLKGGGLLDQVDGGLSQVRQGGIGALGKLDIPALVRWEDLVSLGVAAGTDAERQQAREQLAARYQQRYDERWRAQWFARLSVADAQLPELRAMGLTEIAEELRLAYGTGGDLERLLKLAGQGRLTPLDTTTETREAWLQANRTCNGLAATWRAAHAMVLGGDEGATAAYNAQRDAMVKLAATLAEVSADTAKQTDLATKTWASEGDLRAAYLAVQAVAQQLRALSLDGSGGSGSASAEQARVEVASLVDALGGTALHLTWARLLGSYEASVEADWKAAVYDTWGEQGGRFPFNGRATMDADPKAVDEILGCDKAADSFLAERLAPWVSLATGQILTPEPLGASAPTLRPTEGLRTFVTGRQSRCQAVAALGQDLSFSVAPLKDQTSQVVTETRFSVAGQELVYQRYNPEPMAFVAAPFAPARLVASVQQRQDLICADSSPDGAPGAAAPSLLRVVGARANSSNVVPLSGALGGVPCKTAWRLIESQGVGPAGLYRRLNGLGLPLDLLRAP